MPGSMEVISKLLDHTQVILLNGANGKLDGAVSVAGE